MRKQSTRLLDSTCRPAGRSDHNVHVYYIVVRMYVPRRTEWPLACFLETGLSVIGLGPGLLLDVYM